MRVFVTILAAGLLGAGPTSGGGPVPGRDVFLEASGSSRVPHAGPGSRLRYQVRTTEPRVGVPTVLWVAGRPKPPAWAITPAGAATAFLEELAPVYRWTPEDVDRLHIHEVHDHGHGTIIVSFSGRVRGVPVFRDEVNVALDQRLRLLGVTGYVSPFIAEADGAALDFALEEPQALQVALQDFLDRPGPDVAPHTRKGEWTEFRARSSSFDVRLGEPTRVRRVLFGHATGLEPAYHVEVSPELADRSEMLAYVVSARSGEVLFRHDLMAEHPFTYRVFVDSGGHPQDGPNGEGEIPDRTGTPALPPRNWEAPRLFTTAHGAISTGDPWLTAGSTITNGNNIDAYADRDLGITPGSRVDGFSPGDFRAPTNGPDTFDYRFDVTQNASANRQQGQASIVHAFYVTNWLHDEFYDVGFDEESGNGQTNNYGRGGIEGDNLRVEIQDWSGRNNANMRTPADGGHPIMQMYLWTGRDRVSIVRQPGTPLLAGGAGFGPDAFDVTGELAVASSAIDGSSESCSEPLNAGLTGRIALILRGNCTFGTKVRNAEAAGAVGVVIYDDPVDPGQIQAKVPPFLGSDGGPAVGIPAVSVTLADGLALQSATSTGTVSLRLTGSDARETDSGLDTLVLAHEWGHYASNRLIGNSVGLTGNQARGMGEGWSDFHALLTTTRPDDLTVPTNPSFGGAYAGTSYVRDGYFGIRRVPYSVDRTKNALTFEHIQQGVRLPDVPTAFGQDGSQNHFVHRTGEVWATMLWQGYVSLLNETQRYAFDEAYERMKTYIIGGYKLTPVTPTLVEARDAILLAAYGSDVRDFELLYEAFASRGNGVSAQAPDRYDSLNTPVVESYGIGASADIVRRRIDDERFWCDREGTLDSGETGNLVVELANFGSADLVRPTITLRALTPGLSFPDGDQRSILPLSPFSSDTATLAVSLSGITDVSTASIAIDVTDAPLAFGPTVTTTVGIRVHTDELASVSATDDVEATRSVWTETRLPSSATGFVRYQHGPQQHWWRGVSEGRPTESTLTSPALVVGTGPLTVTYRHRFDFEDRYDGGVVEVSTNGITWEDASLYASPRYNQILFSFTRTSLANRPAYSGNNAAYPQFETVDLEFNQTFSNTTFFIRFRMATDPAASGAGWDIDDIEFTGITNTPFSTVVADRGLCINRPPVANAGSDRVVDERTFVQLDASGSTDPDGDVLDVSWRQVGGPSLSFTATVGAFVAPEVVTDTMVSFELKVFDDEYVSEPDVVNVLVRDVNRAPFAPVVSGPTAAVERTLVTLTATAADPDGDRIQRYRWTQVGGPTVALEGSTDSAVTFTAPENTESATVALAAAASDGILFGTTSSVTVVIRSENREPTAPEVLGKTANEGEWVSLVARATDPDGDPLTFNFEPESGSGISAQEKGEPRFRFLAPQVEADTAFEIDVSADDGFGPGPAVTVVVNVLDIAAPRPDAGFADAAPGRLAASDDGCGCTSSGRPSTPWLGGLALLAALVLTRRKPRG